MLQTTSVNVNTFHFFPVVHTYLSRINQKEIKRTFQFRLICPITRIDSSINVSRYKFSPFFRMLTIIVILASFIYRFCIFPVVQITNMQHKLYCIINTKSKLISYHIVIRFAATHQPIKRLFLIAQLAIAEIEKERRLLNFEFLVSLIMKYVSVIRKPHCLEISHFHLIQQLRDYIPFGFGYILYPISVRNRIINIYQIECLFHWRLYIYI